MLSGSIKKDGEFARVFKRGRRFTGKHLSLCYLAPGRGDETSVNAIGISASKKVGKSVRRNRMKRLVRESYRKLELEPGLRTGFKFVFVVKSQSIPGIPASVTGGAAAAPARFIAASYRGLPLYSDVYKDVKSLLSRAGALTSVGNDRS